MIPVEQLKRTIKDGDKVIFTKNGNVLSADKGNVFTFWKWHDRSREFFKCIELKNNPNHNFGFHNVELFNEKTHREFNTMTTEKLNNDVKEFKNQQQ